jgi:hypothetical protein
MPTTHISDITDADPVMVRADAERIYRSIFGKPIPEIISERFVLPSVQLISSASEKEITRYRHVMNNVNDLEALEVAARFSGKLSLLTQQFHLITYLAETLPENRHFFVNDRDNRIRGVLVIVFGGIRTVWKLAVGFVLLRRLPVA